MFNKLLISLNEINVLINLNEINVLVKNHHALIDLCRATSRPSFLTDFGHEST